VPKAFIVPRAGQPPRVEDVQDWVKARLSQHEYPRQLAFVADLPKTPAGKINRKALRDLETGARAGDSVEPSRAG